MSESDNWAAGALPEVTAHGYVHGASGTGSSETRSYNAAGQLIGLTYADGSAYSYAYDANGNQVLQEASTVACRPSTAMPACGTSWPKRTRWAAMRIWPRD